MSRYDGEHSDQADDVENGEFRVAHVGKIDALAIYRCERAMMRSNRTYNEQSDGNTLMTYILVVD